MLKRGIFVLFVIILFIFAGCGRNEAIEEREESQGVLPAVLLELMYINRRNALPPQCPYIMERLHYFQTPNLDIETDERIARRIAQIRSENLPAPDFLTHMDVIDEIYFLFEMLRYGYAAYQYFGGDEVFLPLKQSMLDKLTQMENPLCVENYFDELLVPFLGSVIADNHVGIFAHNRMHRFGVLSLLHMNHNLIVRKGDSDFYVDINAVTYRIIEVFHYDGRVIEGILPTLTRDGELAWAFGYVTYGFRGYRPERRTIIMRAALENTITGESRTQNIFMSPVNNANVSHENLFAVREKNGIPILENRRLWPIPGDHPVMLTSLPATADRLRDEPVLIIDLRGNGGGNNAIVHQWMYRYTGFSQLTPMHSLMTELISHTVNELHRRTFYDLDELAWSVPFTAVPQGFIPNENLVIVLMDNNVASSGECFVGYLRQMENTLFVGSNTMGAFLTGNVIQTPLPHSRFDIFFGVSLFARPDLSSFEGIGFAPDLWVPPDESLERVLRFIENHLS